MSAPQRTRLGVERLLNEKLDLIRGQRIGLVCNQASVLPDLRHLADVFGDRTDFELTALFGPQHGIRGDVQDNMIETPHTIDERTSKPVYSLYSETREPTAEMLENVDTIVVDLQDVGCRIYTFVYTMANCMRSAKRFGKRVVVCDRPNPIGGVEIEGSVTEREFTSFVGQFEIPTRHGMTSGELARLFNEHFGIGCDLEVVTMDGWEREMYFEETRLPWILPSPNIPTVETCVVFPATVYLEGTELSEGRGTTKPFELNGAPFIDPYQWVAELQGFGFEGVSFRHSFFRPTFQKWAGQTCGGLQIHVTDRKRFKPVILGIGMVKTAYDLYTEQFQWKQNAYEYVFDKNPFDVISGTDRIRKSIERRESLDDIQTSWIAGLNEFSNIRDQFLLY
ncbi:MAG: exo-beta-N-acetylmuramidase NamZ domain-containing protein [Pyrinomonadaceae bacterium]